MEYLPLISIPVFYLLAALIKPSIQPKLPVNLCAICMAVSLTWILLLVLWIMGVVVSLISIAILMGMSVTGLMYKSEGFYAKNKVKNFWFVRLVIVVGGTYSIFTLLTEQWSLFVLIIITSLLLIAITSLLFQGITHDEALKEVKKKNSIIQKLEDCC